jgi:hypothetical protein
MELQVAIGSVATVAGVLICHREIRVRSDRVCTLDGIDLDRVVGIGFVLQQPAKPESRERK